MGSEQGRDGWAGKGEHLARTFLKPQAARYREVVWLAEAFLRPAAKLVPPRPWPEDRGVESILVFDPGALGDMMLLAPFLRNLRASFPLSRIVLAGRPGAGEILQEQGMVDECIALEIPWAKRRTSRLERNQPFSGRWWNFCGRLWELRKRQFDLGFAAGWGGDIRGNLAIWLAGASRRVGYGYGGGDFLLTDVVKPDLSRPHVADRNLQLLEHLGMQSSTQSIEPLQVPPEEARSAAEFLARHGASEEDLVIGIHPGAGSAIREWGDERFAMVAKWASKQWGAKIVWFVDPSKPRPIPGGLGAIEVAGPLRRLMAVLYHCKLLVCNDGGAMHLAATLKIPVVAVFGPTQAEWFGPYGEGHRVVIRNDMWCRPCADRCRWKEPYCMRLITPEQVMDAITKIVNDAGRKRVSYSHAAGA